MVLRAKKAQTDSMKKALLELLVFSIFLVVFISILSSLWNNLKGTSLEEQAGMQFNVFISNLKSMSYTQSEYSLSYSQLLVPAGYYLVAFPAAAQNVRYHYVNDNGQVTDKIKEIFRPKDCNKESEQSCLCLYNKQPGNVEGDANKNIVVCKQIPVKKFVANHINEEELMLPGSSKNFSFTENDYSVFLGESFPKSKFSSDIRGFIEGNDTYAIGERTQNLGFYDSSIGDVPLHDLVIKIKQSVPIPFYVELLKVGDDSSMVVFPYSYALFNRKYFLMNYDGQESCNNKNIHTVFDVPGEPGNFSYCEQTASGLVESEDRIGFCPRGTIPEICACGGGTTSFFSRAGNNVIFPRAISYGNCAKFTDVEFTTLVNFPPEYCNEIPDAALTFCLIYEDKYACASDVCDTGNLCSWVSSPGSGSCVSTCNQITSCSDYDLTSCVDDTCGISELGCVLGINNDQEECMDLCNSITSCSDYEGRFECGDDLCEIYPAGTSTVNKCEYNEVNAQCSTIIIDVCNSVVECSNYITKAECEADACNLYSGIYESCVYDDNTDLCSVVATYENLITS